MALGTITTILLSTLAASSVASSVAGISQQKSAAKRARSQSADAARVRVEEKERAMVLAKEAEGLGKKAKTKASAIAAGKQRRRSTLATTPRGLLDEPEVSRPSLLGE